MRSQAIRSFAQSVPGGRALSLFALAMAALIALPGIASAEYLYRGNLHQFSTTPPVEQPRRVAIEQATGNVFVVEETTGRVLVFGRSGLGGELLTEFGTGVLDSPYGIAIHESGGQTAVYVSDAGTNSIVRFLSDEQPTPSFSVDATYVAPAQGTEADQIQSFASPLALAPNGDLWVADRGANVVKRFDATGAHVAGSNFDGSDSGTAFTGLLDIASNSEGDLYVVDTTGEIAKSEGTSRVERFAEDGSHEATIGPLGPESRSASVAVNPADDSIAVSGDQDGISRAVFAPPIYTFDSANAATGQFALSGDTQGGSFRGMAIHPDFRERIYVVIGKNFFNGNETAGAPGVYLMSDRIPPAATIDPVTTVGSTEATVSGTVDPNAAPTGWWVEYRAAGAATWRSEPTQDAGAGVDPIPVSFELGDLLPGAQYQARIHVSSADGSQQTAVESFTTDPAPPTIVRKRARPSSESVRLLARIEPGGAETTYRFEYGPTDALGHSTEPSTIAAGGLPVNVFAEVRGLSPATTYYFKVVAENSAGAVESSGGTFTTPASDLCPNEEFRSGHSALLAECRAYELVTPSDAKADLRISGGVSTPNGNVVCFNSEDRLVGADPNGKKNVEDGYCSHRTADGWKTEWVTGPAPGIRRGTRGSNVYFLGDDGARAVFASDVAMFGGEWLPPQVGSDAVPLSAYLWETGTTTWIAPAQLAGDPPVPLQEGGSAAQRRPLAISDDASHVLFESDLRLAPEDGNEQVDVYEWSPDGLRVVSTNGSGDAAGGHVPRGPQPGFVVKARTGAISANGGRIFFEHSGTPIVGSEPAGVRSVYMREGDDLILVSPRRGAGPDLPIEFGGASSDGDVVYLETAQQLTGDAKASGAAIYRYDVPADDLQLVADSTGGVKLLDISRDASTVVYRELATGRLMVERGGEKIPLGTLSPLDAFLGYRVATERYDQRSLRITPDGKALVFASSGQFAGSTGGLIAQVYRWGLGEGVENVSAPASGAQTSHASIGAYSSEPEPIPNGREEVLAQNSLWTHRGRAISDDGSRIFFESMEPLVDRDTNGARDVYEWRDGEVDLVSSGTGTGSWYHESSADGQSVFILTYDRLIPEVDKNTNRDLYVAQPDGGFPLPVNPSPCSGEACQGEGGPAPAAKVPAASAGEGNVVSTPGPRILALTKKQLARLARKGRAVVRVRVAAPGRVTARVKGKVNGRKRTVAKAAKVAKRPGTVRLKLTLAKAARKQLAKRGKLRLSLQVRHARSDQPARKAVMLRG